MNRQTICRDNTELSEINNFVKIQPLPVKPIEVF